jgi:hypothetical protein
MNERLRGLVIQGVYGLVLGLVFAAFIPFDLPLSSAAMVPAILALGFGAAHLRDAVNEKYARDLSRD